MQRRLAGYDEDGYAGLGDRFVNVFYSHLHHVRHNGKGYPAVYREFRRILLKPFPYATYYRFHEDFIVVSLVFHTARDPRRLKKILRERQVAATE